MGTSLWIDAEQGDDETGDGTKQRPWRTLAKATEWIAPGDTVVVAPGHYRGPLVITTDDTTWLGQSITPWPWRLVVWIPFLAERAPVRRPVIHTPPGEPAAGVVIEAEGVVVADFDFVREDAWTAA